MNCLRAYKQARYKEFLALVAPLLEDERVRLLDAYMQHYMFTRLRHSIDVAFYSYCIAKLLGWDAHSTARAALLHDLFFYEYSSGAGGRKIVRLHPRIAVENALQICELNAREIDIILKHMWLITLAPPRYKEGYIVTFVDKFCAGREFVVSFCTPRRIRSAFGPLYSQSI